MNFIKEHRKNLKKLTKKQLIQQIINHIEITTQMENQFNKAYEKLDEEKQICESELIKTENELKETQEALYRNRCQLISYKMFESLYRSSQNANEWLVKKVVELETMSIFKFIKNKYAK